MELIAASQIARAQARIAANRPYREGMARIIVEAAAGDPTAAAALLGAPEQIRRALIVTIVGDRGLSGPYNTSVLRAAEHELERLRVEGVETTVVAVGKKSVSYFAYRGIEVAHSFQGFSDRPTYADAREVAAVAGAGFARETVDQVLLVSMRFRSAASQAVETRQLLPLPAPDGATVTEGARGAEGYTEFEPDAEPLLEELAPAALASEVFTALLEGAAAFHTLQQRAMAAATENADELVRLLTREVNRARQDAITTEIMEIVGGAEALRTKKEHA
jgi:F-type H+-transporting ATPase subunit gamma